MFLDFFLKSKKNVLLVLDVLFFEMQVLDVFLSVLEYTSLRKLKFQYLDRREKHKNESGRFVYRIMMDWVIKKMIFLGVGMGG